VLRSTGAVALVAIVLFGAWTRAPGFTRGDLWFDDAWSAMSSRVDLSTASRMVATTPLYSLSMRSWILLHPGVSWWAQIPAFVLGLATIVAVFLLLRYFKTWWPLPFLGALVIAASPVAIEYSTRVKQYNADILLSCLVLWLFERWRRDPTRRGVIALAAACCLAILISATTIIVVGSAAAVAIVAAVAEARRRRDAVVLISSIFVAGSIEYLVWLRHLAHGLYVGWTARGYLLSTKTTHKLAFSLQVMGTGLFHWMIGAPTGHPPDPDHHVTTAGLLIAALTTVVLVYVVGRVFVALLRHPRSLPGPLVVSAAAVSISALAALAKLSPFGGGRTDEVIYASVLLLFAGVVTDLVARHGRLAGRVALAGVVVAAAACVAVGRDHRAQYPVIDLRGLAAKLDARRHPGDVTVVDPWLTFAWGLYDLAPNHVSFQPALFGWSQGFHIVSDAPRVSISEEYFFPSWLYNLIPGESHRLWFVGETGSSSWPRPSAKDKLYVTRNYNYLISQGWRPTATVLTSTHTVAILMTYRPTRH